MADAGGLSFWMALLGLVAACLVKLKNITKICGIVMIISGAIVAWNTGLFGIIGAIFLIIGGGLSLRKDKTNETKDVAA